MDRRDENTGILLVLVLSQPKEKFQKWSNDKILQLSQPFIDHYIHQSGNTIAFLFKSTYICFVNRLHIVFFNSHKINKDINSTSNIKKISFVINVKN